MPDNFTVGTRVRVIDRGSWCYKRRMPNVILAGSTVMTRAPDKLRNYTICNLEAARIIQERGTDAPESLAARWAALVLEQDRVVKQSLTTERERNL